MLKLISNLSSSIIITRELIYALIVILALIACCIVVFFVYQRYYIRPFWISHSENLSNFTETLGSVIENNLSKANKLIQSGKLNNISSNKSLVDTVIQLNLLVEKGLFYDVLVFYWQFYEFHDTYDKNASWFHKRFLYKEADLILKLSPKSITDIFFDNDEFNEVKFIAYKQATLTLLKTFEENIRVLSGELQQQQLNRTITVSNEQQEFELIIHSLYNDLVSYKDAIVRMYATRKTYGFTLQFNIFRLYLPELTNVVFKEKIPAIWKWTKFQGDMGSIVKTIEGSFNTFRRNAKYFPDCLSRDANCDKLFGYKKLADPLTMLRLTSNDDEYIVNGYQKKEVREHFVALVVLAVATFLPITNIGDFITGIVDTIKGFFTLISEIANAITNPIKVMRLVLGFIIGTFLYLSVLIISTIIGIFSYPIAGIIIFVLYVTFTVAWFAIYLVIFVLFVILWLLDMLSGGYVIHLLRCENLPNSWIFRNGFMYENIFKRMFFCYSPCASGYTVAGSFCKRLPNYEPLFCPQQIVAQAYETQHLQSLNTQNEINGSLFRLKVPLGFWSLDTEEKKEWLLTYKQSKTTFTNSCGSHFKKHDHFVRSICEHANVLNIDPETKDLLTLFCNEIYCSKPNKPYFCKENTQIINDPIIVKKDLLTRSSTLMMILCLLITCIVAVYFVIMQPAFQ